MRAYGQVHGRNYGADQPLVNRRGDSLAETSQSGKSQGKSLKELWQQSKGEWVIRNG